MAAEMKLQGLFLILGDINTARGVSARYALFLALLSVGGCTSDLVYDAIPPGATVLAFGDSITHGTGAGAGEDFPRHLAERSGWVVINAGIPGDMARDARRRLPTLLTEYRPQAVLVELGGNDFLRQRRESAVKEDLRAIVQTISASGAQPILVAIPRLSVLRAKIGALADSEIYVELSEEEGVPLISDVLSQVLSEEHLRADPVHPNSEGYQALANGIISRLLEFGLMD